MKAASIILALAVVLGLAREAGALPPIPAPIHDYTLKIGGNKFGFIDYPSPDPSAPGPHTRVYFGRLDSRSVPFTALQGWIGFCSILAMLILLPAVLVKRWRKGVRPLIPIRHSMRDLLWLTLVSGVVVAWWLNHRQHVAEYDELKAEAMQNAQMVEKLQAGLTIMKTRFDDQRAATRRLESKLASPFDGTSR